MKRLYRSTRHRVIAGVCGGIAEYLGVSVAVVRLIVLLLAFIGSGIILYVAGMILIPEEPTVIPGTAPEAQPAAPASAGPSTAMTVSFVAGVALIVIGSLVLLDRLDVFDLRWFWHASRNVLIPLLIIGLGIAILMKRGKREAAAGGAAAGVPLEQAPVRGGQWFRSRTDRKVLGVCGGIAHAMDVDSTVIRLAWVLLTIHSIGLGLIIYLILAFVLPEEPLPAST